MILRSLSVPALALVLLATAAGQNVPFTCSSSGLEHLQPFLQGHPERLQEITTATDHLEQFTQQYAAIPEDERGGNLYVIPVVFHIIHNNGPENINDDQILDAIRLLNEDYNKLNPEWPNVRPEFLDRVADVGITFRLAGLDPDGNCTKGITRTVSELTNDGGQDMKDLIQWPRDQYLNVWVAASAGGAAAYSQYPSSVSSPWAAPSDGVVSLHSYIGSIGTSSPSHAHTLSHEVGHWLNLKHCWGDSNNPGLPENCNMDDNVSDTPNTEGWTSCNLNGATCGSTLDNVENYMEYSYCSKMFTNGQKTRMLAAVNSNTASRSNLWTASNLNATGTSDPQALCAADFTTDHTIVCTGESVTFHDASYHAPTTWQWNLAGAQPATSQDQDPVVIYNEPGVYPVGLTAGNGQTTVSTDVQNYITVLPSTGMADPYSEDFEGLSSLPPTEWVVSNPDGSNNKWELRTNAGFSGTNSLRMHNWGNDVGQVDEIYSTTIDLSQSSTVTMSFRYAFARRTSTNDDVLRFFISNDCGQTWSMRKQLRGSTLLSTVPDQNSAFTPSDASQWGLCEFSNISSSYHVADFRFKFWFQGDGGNDLWIDDINVNGVPAGIDEQSASGLNAQVVPNPSSDEAFIEVELPSAGPVRVEVLDATGRAVEVLSEKSASAGSHRWVLPVEDLSYGPYLVRVQQGERSQLIRFIRN